MYFNLKYVKYSKHKTTDFDEKKRMKIFSKISLRRVAFAVLTLLMIAFSEKARQPTNLIWAKGMGGTGDDRGWCITVDKFGNVYTTGVFQEVADFDPGQAVFNLTSRGVYNIFVQKLNASGNMVWTKRIGGTNADEGYGIAVDNSGNVYTTGYFWGTVNFGSDKDTFNLISARHGDMFVQKLDSGGSLVWARRMGGIHFDFGHSITVDASGNVYTIGNFSSDTVDFGLYPDTLNLISAGGWDFFVQKHDSNGILLWSKRIGGTSDEWGESINVDSSGNVYTTGYFQENVDFDPGPSTFNLTSEGGYDIFVQKLDVAGNLVWAKSIGGTNNEEGYSIDIDATGNIYVTGYFMGTADFDPGPLVFNLTSEGNWDVFVQKLDMDGNLIWAKSMGGTNKDWGNALTLDIAGNVYITGGFQGTADFDPGVGIINLTATGNTEIFIQKLDTDGNLIWVKKMEGNNENYSYSIAVDDLENIYSTGIYSGTTDFDPGQDSASLFSAGNYDIFVLKLNQNVPVVDGEKKPKPLFYYAKTSSRFVRYMVPERCYVNIRYYDMRGRFLATIINQMQNPGFYSLVPPVRQWANGTYVQVFKAGEFVKYERIVVTH